MPIYEYQCKACDHRLEKLQKVSAAPLTQCPQCRQPELSRLISAAGFRLAGGGWYETDFKSAGQKNLAGDSGDKPSTKPEAKPTDSKATA
ncbi:putative regulatory protein, FmdB family [Modicisalibacter ilicicola DSM 19980]|uniref:Putative regulatory protein, FmdB family n=1 Tax=Modicisalibacter ilicicola DSM 19980 TaxID=1121942 RepID=A0A1M4XDY5_9GAMM|nr:zinc ribbon domain-containing protein [Halomonas ilicicola]SHE91486.1 putative regulatory protein, FmdB family [Halomonas ilicicola DSM 19980]